MHVCTHAYMVMTVARLYSDDFSVGAYVSSEDVGYICMSGIHVCPLQAQLPNIKRPTFWR